MKAPKVSTIRYVGYRSLPDGGRRFEFSFEPNAEKATTVSIDAAMGFFMGPDKMALQEAAGICYETIRGRLQQKENLPTRFKLTAADVAQHRKAKR
jgi:hypothetical protein